MSDPFDQAVDAVLSREGAYSHDGRDRGGETMWGVTEAVARAEGYAGPMQALTRDQAKAILKRRYWTRPGLDRVADISPPVAAELFDTAVNMGPATAAAWLQRALNVLNRGGGDYADAPVDGRIGLRTEAGLKRLLALRGPAGERVLLKALNCLQGARYIEIAEARSTDEAFVFGWLAMRVALPAQS
jgi:lysozyme family protein